MSQISFQCFVAGTLSAPIAHEASTARRDLQFGIAATGLGHPNDHRRCRADDDGEAPDKVVPWASR
jgi:hypothetical protein